ncbi:MAG: hypothetical protein K9I36_16710 [Bacteroidia bacterium]|nr:hypothetical protein [Bacteroidia bacterium]
MPETIMYYTWLYCPKTKKLYCVIDKFFSGSGEKTKIEKYLLLPFLSEKSIEYPAKELHLDLVGQVLVPFNPSIHQIVDFPTYQTAKP